MARRIRKGRELIRVRASGKGVGVGLFPSRTPGTIRGFVGRDRSNCCSKIAFRHIVRRFVVRKNSPRKANENKRDVCNRTFRSRFSGRLFRVHNTLSVTGTNPGAGNDRFFVIRGAELSPDLGKRVRGTNCPRSVVGTCRGNNAPALSRGRAIFKRIIRKVSMISDVTRIRATRRSGPTRSIIVRGVRILGWICGR